MNCNVLNTIKYYRENPISFAEDMCGVKLNNYQKLMMKKIFKSKKMCFLCYPKSVGYLQNREILEIMREILFSK